jgi:hypothetical protein
MEHPMTSHLDIGRPGMRALHSGFCDYLLNIDRVTADAMIARVGGMGYERFALAVSHGKFRVIASIDGDEAVIGLAVPVEGRFDLPMFVIPGRDGGIDAAHLMIAGTLDMDDELIDLLKNGPTS